MSCKNCKWHKPDDDGFVICTNPDSEKNNEWTDNNDSCEKEE